MNLLCSSLQYVSSSQAASRALKPFTLTMKPRTTAAGAPSTAPATRQGLAKSPPMASALAAARTSAPPISSHATPQQAAHLAVCIHLSQPIRSLSINIAASPSAASSTAVIAGATVGGVVGVVVVVVLFAMLMVRRRRSRQDDGSAVSDQDRRAANTAYEPSGASHNSKQNPIYDDTDLHAAIKNVSYEDATGRQYEQLDGAGRSTLTTAAQSQDYDHLKPSVESDYQQIDMAPATKGTANYMTVSPSAQSEQAANYIDVHEEPPVVCHLACTVYPVVHPITHDRWAKRRRLASTRRPTSSLRAPKSSSTGVAI